MERMFGNKRDYDAMIRTLYEVQQRDDEMVEEYMLRIHEAVAEHTQTTSHTGGRI